MRRRLLLLAAGAGAVGGAGCRRAGPLAESCLETAAPAGPVGFDAPFSITARIACPEARGARVVWRQLSGPALRAMAAGGDGLRLTARAPSLADAFPGPLPWGIVPLSPRTRGEVVLEAALSDGQGRQLRRRVTVAAAPRSPGLPNVPPGARVYLGGEGWRLQARPPASQATLQMQSGVASLQPDASGEWYLLDGDGRQLILRSARYDETPLDCGRAGCHPAIADAAAASPMTTVLARGLARPSGGAVPAFGAGYPGCAQGCHTVGEPGGVPDGGFSHVASELGEAAAAHTWEDLPRALRRLGGVGCLACHGPAALPEASARWSILRADVCAVCHDAPPRYGQVAAWRQTAMARADRDPRTRIGGACVRCHTTWGFLGTTAARRPPDGAGPVGISCAACHAVHLSPSPPRALLRSGDVCVACHDTDPQGPLPFASAAAIRSGRGGLDPANGAPLVDAAAPAPACTGCHRGHRFTAAPTAAADDVRERARLLWERWAGRPNDTAAPVHAGDLQLDRGTARGRAGWDILMVLEDRGAAAHNAPYARTLLAAAERAMAGGAR